MTMAYTAIGIAAVSLIGTGVSAYAQYEKGQSEKEAANYNATMQDRAALDALNRGAIEASEVKAKARRMISTQIAMTGASGFDSTTGTALDLSVETAGYGELDALKTISNASRGASGRHAQAELDRYQGSSAATGGTLTAAGTAFSGVGSAAGAYYGSKGTYKF